MEGVTDTRSGIHSRACRMGGRRCQVGNMTGGVGWGLGEQEGEGVTDTWSGIHSRACRGGEGG